MDIYIAYGFSILTAVVAIVMMQFKSMTLILIGQITTNLLTALSYFFVGGWSGSGICFIAIVQSLIMFFYDRKNIKPQLWVILLFIAAYVTCSAILFKSLFDIFSAAAAVCFAISIVQKKSFLFADMVRDRHAFLDGLRYFLPSIRQPDHARRHFPFDVYRYDPRGRAVP